MELKVNNYVRTKYGISKIITNPEKNKFNIDIFKKDGITLRCIRQKDIIKSSPNIIDLIEEGDYVNGYTVLHKDKDYVRICIIMIPFDLKNEDIKTVLTREQFKEMEYEIIQ